MVTRKREGKKEKRGREKSKRALDNQGVEERMKKEKNNKKEEKQKEKGLKGVIRGEGDLGRKKNHLHLELLTRFSMSPRGCR